MRLLEGGGERAELELVAREIASLQRRGMAAEDIAILVRGAGTSTELLEEVLAAEGVPHAMQRRRPIGDASIGAALLGLLRCVPAIDGADAIDGGDVVEPDDAGTLGDLLAWLRAPGLLEVPALADRLELHARRAGALGAAQGRALWEQRHWPLETIDRLHEAQARGPLALIERASRELYRLFCAPRRSTAAVLQAEELDEAGALAAGRRAFAELRELARIAPELAPSTARELAALLEHVSFLSGEGPGPGAVAVLDPLALRARRVRALFVCGLQEGAFPARSRPQPLLSQEARRRLAEVSGLRLGEQVDGSQGDQLASERYLLYAAVSRPQELLVLSWHASDDEGQATPRSLFVDDVCDLFEQSLLELRVRRALGAVDERAEDAVAGQNGLISPAEGARRSDEPLRDELLLAELAARPWSASAMERRIACPVAWFVERLLRPGEFEPQPEPLARGALAHAVLKDTLEGLRLQTGSARLRPATFALARELLDSSLQERESEHPLSVAPERRAAVRRRLQSDLERFLAQAAEADSPLEPTELELGFGFDGSDDRGEASALPALELGGGFKLRGRIDRIDVGSRGEAVVYDYKGKDAPPSARWIRDGKLQVALYMHAAEQLLGLDVIGGLYQPLSGSDLRARGVLDGDGGVELDCVSTDVRERVEVAELLVDALAKAREVAEQTASGELAARPQTCAWRGGCQYPTICRCER